MLWSGHDTCTYGLDALRIAHELSPPDASGDPNVEMQRLLVSLRIRNVLALSFPSSSVRMRNP